MRPPKKHVFTLMLSLCIITGSLAPGKAITNQPSQQAKPSQQAQDKTPSANTWTPSTQGSGVTAERRRRPRATAAEKLAHLPGPHPFYEAAASQPLALVSNAQLTLARGMTFKRLLRRRSEPSAAHKKTPPASLQAGFFRCRVRLAYIMPPMPPMPPMSGIPPPAEPPSAGASAIAASVVRIRLPMEAAACNAERVTLVGSRMPISIMSP